MAGGQSTIKAVRFTPRFDRSYKRKSKEQREAVDEAVVQLYTNPSNPWLRVKRVRGVGKGEEIWEASVDMSRRITFEYGDDGSTIIFRNCNGHEIFRQP